MLTLIPRKGFFSFGVAKFPEQPNHIGIVQSISVMDSEAGCFGCWHFLYLHCIPASVLRDAELLSGRTAFSSTNTTPLSLVPQAKVLWCLQPVLERLFCTSYETAVPKRIIQRTLSLGSRSQTCSVTLLCLPSAIKEVVENSVWVTFFWKCALYLFLQVISGFCLFWLGFGLGASFLLLVNKALN